MLVYAWEFIVPIFLPNFIRIGLEVLEKSTCDSESISIWFCFTQIYFCSRHHVEGADIAEVPMD